MLGLLPRIRGYTAAELMAMDHQPRLAITYQMAYETEYGEVLEDVMKRKVLGNPGYDPAPDWWIEHCRTSP